uniref:hypothetical protein n=1 Tax=Winogradskyella sp. TaxID=1883156 RepID=UPI0025E7610D
TEHILLIFISILLSACAMENRKVKSADENYEMATEDLDVEILDDFKVESTIDINKPLINQKLQDFYDLIALQNQHPEFTDEVAEQLKNYTNDSISNFKTDNIAIIKNVKQLGKVVFINDSTQKIKLSYTKVMKNNKTIDTIFAIITNKTIMIDDKTLVSNKVSFSKN